MHSVGRQNTVCCLQKKNMHAVILRHASIAFLIKSIEWIQNKVVGQII